MSALRTFGLALTRRLACGRRGAAAAELAIVAPVIITVLFAVVDIGGAIQQNIRLEAAARSALGYAHLYSDNTNQIRNYVVTALNGWNDVTVDNVVLSCDCTTTANNVTTVVPTNNVCTAGCAANQEQRRFINVNVSRNYSGFVFMQSRTLRGDITLRVQ